MYATEARLLVAPNGTCVGWLGIGLNAHDTWIVKQECHERAHHGRAPALVHLGGIGEELINADDAWVGFVRPPSVANVRRDVCLNEANRIPGLVCDVRPSAATDVRQRAAQGSLAARERRGCDSDMWSEGASGCVEHTLAPHSIEPSRAHDYAHGENAANDESCCD